MQLTEILGHMAAAVQEEYIARWGVWGRARAWHMPACLTLACAPHRPAVPPCPAPRSMEFVATQFPASTSLTKAYVNYRSAPYLPDLVAIVSAIVQLDKERRPVGERGRPPAGPCTGNP